ncbi:VOC family protein [Streptomyces sp. NPDC058293]|uniref:VOC family protein n=1 Tax=Streptomyces sp. NBC_00119 TaxID=2975659 RepID=A0AAU1UF30_9ACTN|nr:MULTISPECIES: VOC family protein [unclassified Streptomyces]MCX4645896.1 VOC family protein [Streptomyces sp. NBC_01446]MCX5318520.1 VOC family protein [Streptomyces sp. NBC_00120]
MKISKTPSAPCWADLSTPDTDAARLFYQGLLGWRSEVVSDPQSQAYGLFRSGDELVAGIGPTRSPKEPSAWLPYYQSAGVDAVIARVKGNGGTVVTGPETIAEDGVFAVCQDPSGAAFGLWQPITNTGFGVVNAPGSFCWFELLTRDPDGSKDFYQSVLGWGAKRHPYGGGGTYTEWSVDTEPFGGMLDTASGSFPEGLPAHWMVYVAVEDTDATAARCKELGGQTLVHPTTIEPGRFAVLADPQGASFAVITYTPR